MPKGKKERDAPAPAGARCDFCGEKIVPKKWNSRTCISCKQKGAPDQSETISYDVVVDKWLKMSGRKITRAARVASTPKRRKVKRVRGGRASSTIGTRRTK